MNCKTRPIPEPIEQLQRQLDQYRSTQSRRAKLPFEHLCRCMRLCGRRK